MRLRLRAGGGAWHALDLAAGERRLVELALPPAGPGDLVVEFDTGSVARLPGEGRALHALLSGLMLCEAHDLASRLRHAGDRAGLRRVSPESPAGCDPDAGGG